MRGRQLFALAVLALILIFAAGALALSQTASQAPPSSNPAQKAQPSQKKKAAEEAGPKIVRWVCTDRICGGCDGNCSRHGHVATDKAGHCACTPNEGSALDKAIRKAFQGHEKGQ